MLNLKPIIFEALKEHFNNVNGEYPKDWAKFPTVQYTEEENMPYTIVDGVERHSLIRYKIDIWDKTSTSNAVNTVNEVFFSCGFKRVSKADVPDPSGLKHTVMRFEGVVDNDTLQVYKK